MRIYTALMADETAEDMFKDLPKAMIDCYPWAESGGYRPVAFGQVCRTGAGLCVRLTAYESEPKAVYRSANDPVYRDSCLEFFINPFPDGNAFCDFELNANGALLLGHFNDGVFRLVDYCGRWDFKVKCKVENGAAPFWSVEFFVPYAFLSEMFPGFDADTASIMRVNFYKCGDETEKPHYGCWSPVRAEKPDFFRPECFGILKLEEK